ncbi:MAG: MFS transporter [Chloroflexi bacterium]|nr:MFS transporter [Chloroflexota bacterium]
MGAGLASLVPARLAPVFAVVGLVSFSTATLGPVFPIYLTSLGLTPASIGLISSTFFVALAVGEGSWGWLGQRLGLRRSLVFGGALSGLAVLALAFTAQPAAIYALSAVRGAAFAAIFPATRSHVALAAPARRRAATIAVLGMAMAGTQSLGALLGGLVADAWGFRAVFVASALLAGVATGVAVIGLRGVSAGDTPRASSGGEAAAADPPSRMPWRALALQGSLAACFFVALGTSGTFLPVLAGPVQGLRPGQVGLIFTLSGLVGMLLTVPLGHLSDRMGRERGMALGLLASAGSMASLAFAVGFWPLLAASSLGRLSYGLFSPAGTARLSEVVPPQRLTTAMGLYGLAEDVGVIAGPALGGAVWGPWGHRGTFLLAALAGLGGLALMPWLARPRRRASA